jgi:CubicO group peptidase (beta-lactamase class C family)
MTLVLQSCGPTPQTAEGHVRRLVSERALRVALMLVLMAGTASHPLEAQSRPADTKAATSAKAGLALADSHDLSRADLEAFLDGFVPYALKGDDIAGAVVVVVKDGEVLLEKGYGYANVKQKRAMDPDLTLVRPGSTSKLFTWTAVMQLVEEGKLDLGRDINDYLDFKIKRPSAKPITLRNLMTHRAGFEEGIKAILMYDPSQLISTEEYLKHHERPILFPPGEIPAYSNYGASLAGYIVQRVSGEPFESYLERHIFAPLGMTRSTFRQPLPEQLRPDVADGYMTASEPPRPFELIVTVPAGGMSTTASDMAKFMIAYLQEGRYQGNRILQPATVPKTFEPAVQKIDNVNTMALGFFEEDRNGRRIRGHGGDTVVFHSDLHLFVDDGVGLFLSFNSRGVRDSVYQARQTLFEAFADRYFPAREPPPSSSVSAAPSAKEDAQLIAGRYESSRRIDSSFLRVFYLLDQTVITSNDDGSIEIPDFLSNKPKRYREIGPFIWGEEGGQGRVALVGQGESRRMFNSDDPSSVLEPVRLWKSAALNIPLLLGAVAVLLMFVALWPLAAFGRWKYGQPAKVSGRELLVTRVLRFAAIIDLLYLLGWIWTLTPIVNNHLEGYNESLDPFIRLLQVGGLLVLANAGAGVWAASQTCTKWIVHAGRVATAVALVATAWIGMVEKLISFNLNY